MPVQYIYLTIAILFEVAGTSMVQASQQFTKPLPSLGVLVGYASSFYFMSLTLKFMPIGIVYALWSGAGIVLIAAIGFIWFKQSIDAPALIGIALIIAGIVIIQLFSKTAGH